MRQKNILLFIINPFIATINSIIHIREKGALTLLYCWFLLFGIAFCADNPLADSFRYVEDFKEQANPSWSDYLGSLQSFFTFDSQIRDIYTITAGFIVHNISDNYHWLFLFFAAVFGFFYIKSLEYLVKKNSCSPFVFYALFFLFCISNPIFNINGVRFWTAAWITVYSLLKINIDKKYVYTLLLCTTPLFHAAYIVVIPLVVLILFTSRFSQFWFIIYLGSSFFSVLSVIGDLTGQLDFLPTITLSMIASNTEEAKQTLLNGGEQLPLYARVLESLPTYLCIILTVFIFVKRKCCNNTNYTMLLGAYLIVSVFANFTMNIPSTGVRFIKLTYPFLTILWAMNSNALKKYNAFVCYGIPISFAYSLVPLFRNISSVTEIDLYIFPLPVTVFKYLFFA